MGQLTNRPASALKPNPPACQSASLLPRSAHQHAHTPACSRANDPVRSSGRASPRPRPPLRDPADLAAPPIGAALYLFLPQIGNAACSAFAPRAGAACPALASPRQLRSATTRGGRRTTFSSPPRLTPRGCCHGLNYPRTHAIAPASRQGSATTRSPRRDAR